MQLHEQFNLEDPICLYCNSRCDVKGDGSPTLFLSNKYTCINCHEVFETAAHGDEINAFLFTCNDLLVTHVYTLKNFGIHKLGSDDAIWTSEFKIDFSDKEKLYNKLKVYLTFA